MRSFKDLRNGKADSEPFNICDDHVLTAKGGVVSVDGPGGAVLFEKAEEVEENKVSTSPEAHLHSFFFFFGDVLTENEP